MKGGVLIIPAALAMTACVFSPEVVFATERGEANNKIPELKPLKPEEVEGTGAAKLRVLGVRIANFLVSIVGVLAVLYTIYGGVIYLTAAGNPEAAKRGKDAIIHGIIGIVVIMFTILIIRAVIFAVRGP